MSTRLELFHWEPNTYFLKPLIALAEKQAVFVSRWFDPTRLEQFAPGFPHDTASELQLEREGPLLIHGDALISSSFFMLEYIAEAVPGAQLLQQDAFAQYRARAWGQFLVGLGADVSVLGCARHLAPVLRDQPGLRARLQTVEPVERRNSWLAVLDGTYDETVLTRTRERLRFPVGRLERTLSDSPWLAGPEYSIADIDAFALLRSLPSLAPGVVNEQQTPGIMEFLSRMHARKAVQQALGYSRSGSQHEAFVPGAEPSRWG